MNQALNCALCVAADNNGIFVTLFGRYTYLGGRRGGRGWFDGLWRHGMGMTAPTKTANEWVEWAGSGFWHDGYGLLFQWMTLWTHAEC